MKQILKLIIFNVLKRFLLSNKGVTLLDDVLLNKLKTHPTPIDFLDNVNSPYSELYYSEFTSKIAFRSPIFLTGRFRSGSTFLWNIFRQLDGVTSYYEPLNERRWFDPAVRGERVDATHVNVKGDYWREYDGLSSKLCNFYKDNWIDRDLYMDENSSDWDLQRYITEIIDATSDRPVLQFNRVDFRLPWLRRVFPQAKFIHIHRHPRDQWLSTLLDIRSFGPNGGTLNDFVEKDKFYLSNWVRDLQHWFPFLRDWNRHPYYHFYFLWKLSYLFGLKYCHTSIMFEELVTEPKEVLEPLFSELEIENPAWEKILPLIQKPKFGKWQNYASDDWFGEIESICEYELVMFLGNSSG